MFCLCVCCNIYYRLMFLETLLVVIFEPKLKVISSMIIYIYLPGLRGGTVLNQFQIWRNVNLGWKFHENYISLWIQERYFPFNPAPQLRETSTLFNGLYWGFLAFLSDVPSYIRKTHGFSFQTPLLVGEWGFVVCLTLCTYQKQKLKVIKI